MTPEAVYDKARNAGLSEEAALVATCIAWGESLGKDGYPNPEAVGDLKLQDSKWGPSVGLWQIRTLKADKGTGRPRDETRLKDPDFNARSMAIISQSGKDFSPWTVYREGIYKKYLDRVRGALKNRMSVAIIRAVVDDPLLEDVPVKFEPGWESRGRPYAFRPKGCVIHHTATSRRAPGDYPSMGIVRDGRSDLPGPLSQFGLGRNGTVYVIAAGTANHAGPGGWRGLSGNTSVWGIEAENDGIGEPWSKAALENYVRLVAALARHTPFGPEMVACHREWSDYKIDPTGIDGDWFRAQVKEMLGKSSPTKLEENEMTIVFDAPKERGGGVWMADGVFRKPVRTGDTWPALEKAGVKHIGVAPVGLFDDLINIEDVLASINTVLLGLSTQHGAILDAVRKRG